MKPTSQISFKHQPYDGEESPLRIGPYQPRTDCNFHPSAGEVQTTGSSREVSRSVVAPGFRDLSNEFLRKEAKRNYVAEVLFFVIIVGVSAWPIVSMAQTLARSMK